MTAVPSVISVRCHYCSKFRHPSEVLDIGNGGAKMCLQCHEWHARSIQALAEGGVPPGCFECRATWDELRLRIAPGDNPDDVKMYLTPKDGIYQLLCSTCSDAYERKRVDLLGDTAYGHLKKLKGAK